MLYFGLMDKNSNQNVEFDPRYVTKKFLMMGLDVQSGVFDM